MPFIPRGAAAGLFATGSGRASPLTPLGVGGSSFDSLLGTVSSGTGGPSGTLMAVGFLGGLKVGSFTTFGSGRGGRCSRNPNPNPASAAGARRMDASMDPRTREVRIGFRILFYFFLCFSFAVFYV